MRRSVSLWLLTGLALWLVAAANHWRTSDAPLDPATMAELSRRLDLVVSGPSALPSLPLDPDLSARNGSRASDHR